MATIHHQPAFVYNHHPRNRWNPFGSIWESLEITKLPWTFPFMAHSHRVYPWAFSMREHSSVGGCLFSGFEWEKKRSRINGQPLKNHKFPRKTSAINGKTHDFPRSSEKNTSNKLDFPRSSGKKTHSRNQHLPTTSWSTNG